MGMFEGLMKKVGLELGFGRWADVSEWREGVSRKATYISCTKCFSRGSLSADPRPSRSKALRS